MTVRTKTIVQCGNCNARYRVTSKALGRIARCRKCGHRFVLAPKPTLDDSVLDWLLDEKGSDDEEGTEETPGIGRKAETVAVG